MYEEILTHQKHQPRLESRMAAVGAGRDKEQRRALLLRLTPVLREALEEQMKKTEALHRAKGVIITRSFIEMERRSRRFGARG